MDEDLTVEFGESDATVLKQFKRQTLVMPEITTGTPKKRKEVEEALQTGARISKSSSLKLPPEIIEGAKAAFTATGGNISEVASLYDIEPTAVLTLAVEEGWSVYGGSVKAVEARGRQQLIILRDKLWARIEKLLDSIEIEKKDKADLVQHRAFSEYVEPLASRNATFKTLMDQYMRVSTLLEPEVFADDPDATNFNARKAREGAHPGGIEGVNRELADFFSEVVVGIADKIKDRELNGYSHVIDTRGQRNG
jgi:hypothetical protein